MASVNYIGVEAICRYIESTKMCYFGIFPAGRSNAKPVYKQGEKATPAKAAEKFRDWADVILSGDQEHTMQYELRLYDSKENGDGEEEVLSGRSGMVVTFQLTGGGRAVSGYAAPSVPQGGISMDMYLTLLKEKSDAERRADKLEFELNDTKRKLLEAEQELEEIGDDGDGDDVGGMGTIAKMFMPMLMNHFTAGSAPGNINGTPDATASSCDCQRCKNLSPKLMTALGELKRIDGELDEHVVRLAKIAKNNPGQWAFLTDALKNM